MSQSRLSARIRRTAIIGGLTGAALIALPTAAYANTGWGGTLTQNQTSCVQQYAGYQVRGEGTATAKGAKFTMYRNGGLIYASSPSSAGFAAEFRTSWGNFPGPGTYQVCAKNTNASNTLVTIRILSDGEI